MKPRFDCNLTRLRAAKCLYLWRCGLWPCKVPPKPAVGHTPDHAMIFADPVCLEPEAVRRGSDLASEGKAERGRGQPAASCCFSRLASSRIRQAEQSEDSCCAGHFDKNRRTTDGGIDRG